VRVMELATVVESNRDRTPERTWEADVSRQAGMEAACSRAIPTFPSADREETDSQHVTLDTAWAKQQVVSG
jgi:hypothetical protein